MFQLSLIAVRSYISTVAGTGAAVWERQGAHSGFVRALAVTGTEQSPQCPWIAPPRLSRKDPRTAA